MPLLITIQFNKVCYNSSSVLSYQQLPLIITKCLFAHLIGSIHYCCIYSNLEQKKGEKKFGLLQKRKNPLVLLLLWKRTLFQTGTDIVSTQVLAGNRSYFLLRFFLKFFRELRPHCFLVRFSTMLNSFRAFYSENRASQYLFFRQTISQNLL